MLGAIVMGNENPLHGLSSHQRQGPSPPSAGPQRDERERDREREQRELHRQQRAVSPAQEKPQAIPSIKLTTATPLALSPRQHQASRHARTITRPDVSSPSQLLVLHEAPPSLPVPKPRIEPVKDHNTESRLRVQTPDSVLQAADSRYL